MSDAGGEQFTSQSVDEGELDQRDTNDYIVDLKKGNNNILV
jgi:hypothetical protein